jgi:hypothetical protein
MGTCEYVGCCLGYILSEDLMDKLKINMKNISRIQPWKHKRKYKMNISGKGERENEEKEEVWGM